MAANRLCPHAFPAGFRTRWSGPDSSGSSATRRWLL